MKHMVFQRPTNGRYLAVSPDDQFVAYVLHSTVLHVEFATDRDTVNTTANDDGDVGEVGADGRTRRQRRNHDLQSTGTANNQLCIYSALDEITGLIWSPNSRAIAVLMSHRSAIEVVRISDSSIICRVDGGINDLQSSMWNPRSTCVYWFGKTRSFALHLRDNSMTELEAGIVSKTVGENLADVHLRLSGAVDADDALNVSSVISVTPLAKFSLCGKYFYTVSTRTVVGSHGAGGKSNTSSAVAKRTASAGSSSGAGVSSLSSAASVQFEHTLFTVRSAGSHKVLFSAPVEALGAMTMSANDSGDAAAGGTSSSSTLLHSVSDLLVTSHCVVLFDQKTGNVLLLSNDGRTALYPRLTGRSFFEVACSSNGGRTLACTNKERCFIAIAVKGKYFEMGAIPLKPSFIPNSTPLLTEVRSALPPALDPASTITDSERYLLPHQSTPTYSMEQHWSLESFDSYSAEAMLAEAALLPAATPTRTLNETMAKLDPLLAKLSVSPGGNHIAVVPAALPSVVIIVDVLRSSVHSILRHRQLVTGLKWTEVVRPGLRRAAAAAADQGPDGSMSAETQAVPTEDRLAILTDNHDGYLFLWQPDAAMCVAVPNVLTEPDPMQSHAVTPGIGHAHRECNCPTAGKSGSAADGAAAKGKKGKGSAGAGPAPTVRGVPIGFRADTLMWGTAGESALVMDSLRETTVKGTLVED